MTDSEYAYLSRRIKELLKLDLSSYKSQQMRRRLDALIQRRMEGNVLRYCSTLASDPELLKELKDLLTINVSEFFRNPLQFEYLKSHVFPELLKGTRRLNIWNAGCSIGAETYSMAIILDELGRGSRIDYRILATDLDEEVLRKARAGGPFLPTDMKSVSDGRLKKYFKPALDGRGYYVTDSLKQGIEFRRQNLLQDAFEKDFHLISCRNVTIYFSNEAKSTLFLRFHESLLEGGLFFVGGTEALLGEDADGYQRTFGNFYRRVPRRKAAAA